MSIRRSLILAQQHLTRAVDKLEEQQKSSKCTELHRLQEELLRLRRENTSLKKQREKDQDLIKTLSAINESVKSVQNQRYVCTKCYKPIRKRRKWNKHGVKPRESRSLPQIV